MLLLLIIQLHLSVVCLEAANSTGQYHLRTMMCSLPWNVRYLVEYCQSVVVPKRLAPGEPPKRRLCVDFRKVNELQQQVITEGKSKGQISIHPLSKIDEMYAKLKGAKVFSTILTKKEMKFVWIPECQKSFELLSHPCVVNPYSSMQTQVSHTPCTQMQVSTVEQESSHIHTLQS